MASFGLLDFNPRPPCGGRLKAKTPVKRATKFQSTPSVWRATHTAFNGSFRLLISIHALRVEGDLALWNIAIDKFVDFNPRPPCGGRLGVPIPLAPRKSFQSTPSVWRATS